MIVLKNTSSKNFYSFCSAKLQNSPHENGSFPTTRKRIIFADTMQYSILSITVLTFFLCDPVCLYQNKILFLVVTEDK
jgi:hypothetical protein